MARHTFGLSLALLSSSCTLLGLDEFEVPRCESDAQCALALNAENGFYAECRPFVCTAAGACERDDAERCDGADNDCDLVVDEGALGGEAVVVVEALGGADRVTYAAGSPGRAVASTRAGRGRFALVAPSTSVAAGVEIEHGRNADDNPSRRDEASGCAREGGTATSCNEVDVALGFAGDRVLAAAVSTQGCDAGQLRVGTLGEDGTLLQLGPRLRSNVHTGVDPTADGACTGARRAGCADGGAGCGAARPALATIETAPVPQGLLAWIGATVERAECGGEAADVESVVLYLRTGELDGAFEWVSASDEGAPLVLGRTSGGGPPAVAAVGSRGFLVGFGDLGDRLSLWFVPAQPAPPDNPGFCSGCDPNDRAGREIGAVVGVSEVGRFAGVGDGAVDHVAASVGALRRDGDRTVLDVGLAWRQGCGTPDARIGFRRVVLEAPGGAARVIDEGRAVEVAVGAVGPPAVGWQDRGFVVAAEDAGGRGFGRDGRVASSADDGGWLVVYALDGDLRARRALELDGALLDEPPIELADGDTRAPFVHDQGRVTVVFHDASADTVEAVAPTCGD